MALLLPIVLFAYIFLYAFALSLPPLPQLPLLGSLSGDGLQGQQRRPSHNTLDAWIEWEEGVALQRLLANVKPGGRNTEKGGVADGTVIASPSTEHPDYYFQWVRDAALTMSTLVRLYTDDPSSPFSSHLAAILDAYTALQSSLQHTSNPSGGLEDLRGLGEPKFHADGSPYMQSWGRPQRDGPALRAIALMQYLRTYNASHPSLWTTAAGEEFFGLLYKASLPANSVIKADLEYVSHFWDQPGFDLWEEVEGLHFFTLMVSLRALREGAGLARAFGDVGAGAWYEKQAVRIEAFLKGFWDEKKGSLVQTLGTSRQGLDCGVLLGSLHGMPSEDLSGDGLEPVYPPWSHEVLNTLHAFAQDQGERFAINRRFSASTGNGSSSFEPVALGRYPEDKYNGYGASPRGGNPWFLCTTTAASILYHTASHLVQASSLTLTAANTPFFASLLAGTSTESSSKPLVLQSGTYNANDAVFDRVVERLANVADGFLGIVRQHVGASGEMSEQFDGSTGYMRGARDLTWSYGSWLGAARARKNV